MVTTKINIDMASRYGSNPQVNATQGDTNSRKVAISLFEHGKPWIASGNIVATIRYCKPNDSTGLYNTLPDGSVAYSIAENVVTVTLAPQMLNVPGKVKTDVLLSSGEKSVAVFGFIVKVDKNPLYDSDGESEDYYNAPLLPPVTAEDAGKFLRVAEDGTWCVQAVTNVEEVGA